MSNPAVIYLAQTKTNKGHSFRVEDNIGEAIHLHYDNIRIDLSTKEFLETGVIIENAIEKLVNIPDFKLKYFDPFFLTQIGHYMFDLEDVRFEQIAIKDLEIKTKGLFGLSVISKISNSRVVKALRGNNIENDRYNQINFYGESNKERVVNVEKIIQAEGYPFNNEYIVLFNNQNIIRDGQHRASSLFLNGYDEIQVIRLIFRNNSHSIFKYPWLRELFYFPPKRFMLLGFKVYKKIRRMQKKWLTAIC